MYRSKEVEWKRPRKVAVGTESRTPGRKQRHIEEFPEERDAQTA